MLEASESASVAMIDATFAAKLELESVMPVSAALREPTERRRRIDDGERRTRVPVWIARHEGVATAGLSGRRTHGILEVGPSERERPSHDVIVDLSDGEDADETFDALAGERCVTSLLEQIKNRRDAVSRDHPLALSAFNRCPQCCSDIGIGPTIENDVEEDVQIEQKTLHRYFRLRCRRCASAGTLRPAPRSSRRTGGWSSVLGGFDNRSR